MPTEEFAIVLDYLSEGRAEGGMPGYKREKRVAHLLGESFFALLEVVLRENTDAAPAELMYIGRGTREKVHHIVKRLNYTELTATAKSELDYALEKLIKEQEARFVRFYNECDSLTTRLHRLELLPGVGKKHMWEIVKMRNIKKFESFDDIATRVKLLPDASKLIAKRIIWELKGEDERGKPIKYNLFVNTPLFAGDTGVTHPELVPEDAATAAKPESKV